MEVDYCKSPPNLVPPFSSKHLNLIPPMYVKKWKWSRSPGCDALGKKPQCPLRSQARKKQINLILFLHTFLFLLKWLISMSKFNFSMWKQVSSKYCFFFKRFSRDKFIWKSLSGYWYWKQGVAQDLLQASSPRDELRSSAGVVDKVATIVLVLLSVVRLSAIPSSLSKEK